MYIFNQVVEFFFVVLFTLALVHSVLASFTKLLFRKKPTGRLSHNQLRVQQGSASMSQRIELFFQTFLVSFLTLNVYLIALGVTIPWGIYIYFLNSST